MINYRSNRKTRKTGNLGFTLVELAIVLAVTGVLFTGLYRLLSSGNTQVKDSSVAAQQQQLISAVKAYLATDEGSQWMAGSPAPNPAGGIKLLPLPGTAPDGITNNGCKNYYAVTLAPPQPLLQKFCDSLPPAFSSATPNAYGQDYKVGVLVPAFTTPRPTTYSFMIVTRGGDPIPDADGGRISGSIGADGGFVYSSAVCTAAASATTACGSYGGWTADITTYGFAGSTSHVASRTYISPEANLNDPWLARLHMAGDADPTTAVAPNSSPKYNTMSTSLFLGKQNVYFATDITTNTPEPATNLGGTMYLQNGQIAELAATPGVIPLDLEAQFSTLGHRTGNPLARFNSFCTIDPTVGGLNGLTFQGDCVPAIQVNGDMNVLGRFYAGVFIYQTNAASSDMRLKKDIAPISDPLKDVMRLKPVSYAFKSNGEKSLGFIAQDLEKIYPDLVIQDAGGFKAVKYDALIAPVVGSVQQLQQENAELKKLIQEQAERLDRLEKAAHY